MSKNNEFLLNQLSDNDRSSLNCASMLKGGWWWKSCGRGLNGLYLSNPQDLTARQGNSKLFLKHNMQYILIRITYNLRKLNCFLKVSFGSDGEVGTILSSVHKWWYDLRAWAPNLSHDKLLLQNFSFNIIYVIYHTCNNITYSFVRVCARL